MHTADLNCNRAQDVTSVRRNVYIKSDGVGGKFQGRQWQVDSDDEVLQVALNYELEITESTGDVCHRRNYELGKVYHHRM